MMKRKINIMSSGTNLNKYISWVTETTNKSKEELFNPNESELEVPFLSVITRTQGKRPEALAETLLCLTGQTDMDFELLLIGHNLNEPQKELIDSILDNLPEEMAERTRYIPVDGGTRTTPLNVGFSEAKGEYIAILDDDDIVFDNWVEMFKKAATKEPGTVLHSYSLTQKWMTVKINSDIDALRAVAAHTDELCVEYDWIKQLSVNKCPPVGLAFPRYAFQDLGIKFDESLNTTEDWDFLMRTGLITGVTDICEPTCIYRLWINTETSQTLHNKDEWKKNHIYIQNKFKEMPVLLPKGASENIIMEELDRFSAGTGESNKNKWSTIYFRGENGFCEKDSIQVKINGENKLSLVAEVGAMAKGCREFRWDPCEYTSFLIEDLSISYTNSGGQEREIPKNKIYSNGYLKDGKYVYLKSDPKVMFYVSEDVKRIKITYKMKGITDDILNGIVKINKKYYSSKIIGAIKRKVFGK